MVKKTVCLAALLAALMGLFCESAAAQNYLTEPPKPTIQEYGPLNLSTFQNLSKDPPAGECGNPAGLCLFYGGDFFVDALYNPELADDLANETTLLVPGSPYGAAVWVPFTVPAATDWEVTGLFTNNFSTYGVLDGGSSSTPEPQAFYSINIDVGTGSAGTVIASGTAAATSTATGRSGWGLAEYTVQVTGLKITLGPGSYWMAVVPICTNGDDANCESEFWLSDVEYLNVAPRNARGAAEVLDDSFFDSPFLEKSFLPASTFCASGLSYGCDAWSAGVLGKIEK